MAANMIPEKPRTFAPGSLEDVMFGALENLPEEYYVIHSFRIVTINEGIIKESETDFVIFHREKGIICLEAKAGHVQYINGDWYYGSGIPMSHDGPYNQASQSKWRLKDYITDSRYGYLLDRCKLLHAVWFPSVSEEELRTKIAPPEAELAITLTKEDLDDPSSKLEEIFALDIPKHIKTNLSQKDGSLILRKILCPSFDLVPTISIEHDLKKQVFHRMLSEQKCVLNFLVEQRSAVIQGVAGTGKTLIALEKARRHADAGERVLFLCYNRFLRDFIASTNEHSRIDYYTIDGFACKLCNTSSADYVLLKSRLEEMYVEESFPYQHIIIDEGQDFGQENIEENNIIRTLESIILDRNDEQGSFYVFYDPMQLVQGEKIPEYILKADCKLTLYKNCRNTENIAITSMKPLHNKKRLKLINGCIKGTVPKMIFCNKENQADEVLRIISTYEESGLENIVILTCKTENTTDIASIIQDGKVKGRYLFTTCRKFKGLEADAVIITDVDKDILTSQASRIFYVGASRARLFLSMTCLLDDQQCADVLKYLGILPKPKRLKKQLATALSTVYLPS